MFSALRICLVLLATRRIQKGQKDLDHSEKLLFRKHGSNQGCK